MHRAYLRALFTLSLAVGAGFGLVHAVRACEIPAPVQMIDPPGFYGDAASYTRDVKPMHNFIAQPDASADKGDWTCALSQPRTWTDVDALMDKIPGYQGQYERSWVGTDFAMVLLRMSSGIRKRNQARLDAIAPWLGRIAIATRNTEAINHLHNSLVYQAGLNLTAIGTATDNSNLIDSGFLRVRKSIRDIGPGGALAHEAKRGDRTLHYHTFALIPLVLAAGLVQRHHIDLYRENNRAIGRLANLVTDAVTNPASFGKVAPIKQALFPWTPQDELYWMEPYYVHVRDLRLPALIAPRRPFSEWRLGGNVATAWSTELSGHREGPVLYGIPLPTSAQSPPPSHRQDPS